MNIWDEAFPALWEDEAQQIKKILCDRSRLFRSIATDSLVRCLYWIVFPDCEGRINAKVEKGLRTRYGNLKQELRERSRKIDALAKKFEKYCLAIPLLPVPPLGIPEQLRDYAEQLRQYAARSPKCQPRWSDKGTETLRFLVETVTERTGRPHFKEIGDILTEVSELLGIRSQIPGRRGNGQPQTRLIYDPDTIKMRLKRNSRTAE